MGYDPMVGPPRPNAWFCGWTLQSLSDTALAAKTIRKLALHFFPSFSIGLLLALLNGLLWYATGKWLVANTQANKSWLALLSVLKLGVLAAVIWILMAHYKINPAGFLLGFSVTLLLPLLRTWRWS